LIVYTRWRYKSILSRWVWATSLRGNICTGAYMTMHLARNPFEAGIGAVTLTSLRMEKIGSFDCPVSVIEVLKKHLSHSSPKI